MTFKSAWGDVPENFHIPEPKITNILNIYYRDKNTKVLHQFTTDGDYGHEICIDETRMALAQDKIQHGPVLALIKGNT